MKQFKKFWAMMLAFALVVTMLPVSALAAENAAFTVSSVSGKAGDQVTVTVDIANNPGFFASTWTVSYDTSRLEKVEYTSTAIDGVTITNQGDNFLWENTNMENIQYNGKVLDLKFKIKEDAPAGDAEVTITKLLVGDSDGNPVDVDVMAGKITVEEKLETLIPFTKANHTDSGDAIHSKYTGVLGLKVEGIKITNWTEWKQGGNYQSQSITIYVDPVSKDDAVTLSLSLAEGQAGSGPLIDNPATYTLQLADGAGSYTASYLVIGSGGLAPRLHIPITFKLGCTEHSFADATCNTPKTCTVCGVTQGEADSSAHSFADATCSAPKTCSVCGANDGAADPDAHNYVEGVCSYCGATQAVSTYEVKVNGSVNDAFYVVTGKDDNGFDVLGDKLSSTQSDDAKYRIVTVPVDVTRIGYSDAEGYVAGINVSPENAEASIDYVEFSIKNPDGTACTNATVTVEDSAGYKQRPFDYEWEGMWSISAVIGETYTITVNAPGCKTAVVEKTFASSSGYYQSFDITLEEEAQEPEAPAFDGVILDIAEQTPIDRYGTVFFSLPADQDLRIILDTTGALQQFDDIATGTRLEHTFADDCVITVTADELAKYFIDEEWRGYLTEDYGIEVDENNGYMWLMAFNGSKTYEIILEIVPEEEPEQPAPESNPITEIEVSHPNIVTDETTGAMTMTMTTGASEQIDMSFAVADAELEATQIVFWSSDDDTIAEVDQTGKITAKKAGTVTITAKAVDASGVATVAEDDEVLAQFTLTVADPASGYTVTMGEDVEAVVNGNVSVPVTIGHTGDVTKYNAFDLTFQYDPAVLELTSTKIDGMTVTVKDGKIHVERYGTDMTVGGTALTLTFKALKAEDTNVKLTSAKVDISESALMNDAPDASVIDNITLISVTGYTVTLPAEFIGESSVLPGESYTFEAKDKNYNYTFADSTMGDQPVTVTDNGDGTFTIENVLGNIIIRTEKTGKTFDVTLGQDMTSEAANAQYMTDYAATLNKAAGFNYNVTVTIGGQKFTGFTYDAATGLITIPGEAITGQIVFNSNKTAQTADKHSVQFAGEYGDIAEDTALEVVNGTDYVLTINKVLGYKYTVTATMAGETVEVIDNNDGTYTIKNVTGDLVITIAKEYDLTVEVKEYVTLNGKTMFLVTATGTVDDSNVLSYGGTAMFYSNQYDAWSYLVVTEGTLSVEDAKAQITLNKGIKVELNQTYNVNETANNTVDINDAQLVFDMYNNEYQDIDTVGMQKFLKADVNGDKKIDVNDAAAIVSEIVKAK